jgi:hypothetical protein
MYPDKYTSKNQKPERLKIEPSMPWRLTSETYRLTIAPLRVYRPVVADSHHFDEEHDPKAAMQ